MSPTPAEARDRVLRSRRVVLPDGELPACVVVRDGRIASVEVYDAPLEITDELGSLALLPGLVDTHVHVNEPGRTEWEGFRTATRAAAAGGVTAIVDMPLNSVPATTDAGALRAKVRAMAGQLHVDVGLWGGVVPGNAPELAGLADAGAMGFKCFLSPSGVDEFGHVSEADLREAMPEIARLELPLLVHAEDPALLREFAGPVRAYAGWLASRPPEAEARAIAMLAGLAAEFGVHVHVVHVASHAGVDAVRSGFDAILRTHSRHGMLTGETCPHYLLFSAEEIADGATAFKCAPPIRGAAERFALREALRDTDIGLVASDHSPSPAALKDIEGGDFTRAWGGIASLELGLSATWTAMRNETAALVSLADWMAAAPARLAGLSGRKGGIVRGYDADFVAFAPEESWVVDAAALQQRHAVTPYQGRTLEGRVHTTWRCGALVFADGEPVGGPTGRWLRRGAEPVDPAKAFA